MTVLTLIVEACILLLVALLLRSTTRCVYALQTLTRELSTLRTQDLAMCHDSLGRVESLLTQLVQSARLPDE